MDRIMLMEQDDAAASAFSTSLRPSPSSTLALPFVPLF